MRVTVITVCYNASSTIEKTMMSVLMQTYADMEYLVVDGSSTDDTTEKVKKLFSSFPDKRTKLVSEPDRGIYDAMNKGISMANGEWVNMMNSGDYFNDNNVLEKVLSDSNINKYGIIYSDFILHGNNGSHIEIASETTGNLLHQSIIYKKELHQKYGFYSTKQPIIASDFLFFCLIPSSLYYKTDTIIANYNLYGISNQGYWCALQILCLKYVFHKIELSALLKNLMGIFILDNNFGSIKLGKMILSICSRNFVKRYFPESLFRITRLLYHKLVK